MLTILGLIALPAAAAQADDTWSGLSTAGGANGPHWSDTNNWLGNVAPTSPAGTLTFPDLGACAAPATCYTSSNNLGPISATGLVLSNTTAGTQYKLQGSSVSVDASGIRDNSGGRTGDVIQVPLVLSANQSWLVGGGFGNSYNSLSVTGAVSGAPSTLTVPFVPGAGNGSSGDLFVTSDMEVGAVNVTGSGGFHIGGPGGNGSVNGTNGNTVAINSGATLIANPNSNVGTLSVTTGGELLLGTGKNNVVAVQLAVDGGVSIDSSAATNTQTYISRNGSTPGTDFSQVTATGPVTLGGILNLAQGSLNSTGTTCATLSRGDVATLFTTTGTVSRTFTNPVGGAPITNGQIIPMAAATGACPTPPQVRINYTPNNVAPGSVTATVVSGTTPTTTRLAAPNPSPAFTNQPVSLTATVTTNPNGNVPPAGTIVFSSSGKPIPGCTAQPVTHTTGSSGTATCTTSFLAAGSPESLTAAFTGTTASRQGSSISALQSLPVTKAATATALTVSDRSPAAGGTVTYTATVTPGFSGVSKPSGTVQFLDGGTAIAGCGGSPLTPGSSSSTASCTVTYPSSGSHSITAGYGGDGNFGGSSSPATSVTAQSQTTATTKPGPISATTSPATRVGTTQARLHGSVSTGGASTTWKFEYGLSTAHHNHATAAQTIAAGQGTVSVSSVLKGLAPNVRYHYRLVVSSQTAVNGSARGRYLTFTTKNTGKLVGPGGRLTVIGRTILVSEKCQSNVLCSGRFSLTTKARAGKKKKLTTVVCASARFRIKAHRKGTARVKLSSTCLSLLKPHRRLTVNYTAHSGTGQLGQRRRVTLVLK